MTVDRRTRFDDPARVAPPAADRIDRLAEAFATAGDRLGPGVAWLGLRPLSLEVDDATWILRPDPARGTVSVARGTSDEGARWRMSAEVLDDVVEDQVTPMGLFSSGRLDQPTGRLGHLLDWWLAIRSALDDVPVHVPGAVAFEDADGRPLDLGRSFTHDDDPADVAAFLEAAGFVHLAGWYPAEVMAEISADMDRAAPTYSPDDGRSWWATVAAGGQRLVRMQGFHRHSAAVAELLDGPELAAIADLAGDGHVADHAGMANPIEALFKPVGVVEGISDVPWHKDCSLGRHSYECCRLTVGISVTAGGSGTGQLRVRAGSHRALVWPALDQPRLDLPDVPLPTEAGDVTVHLSCTLHMAEPPTAGERRVMYTDCRLPLDPTAAAEGRRRLAAVREAAPVTVSQPAAG
jgi:hypothetical protein